MISHQNIRASVAAITLATQCLLGQPSSIGAPAAKVLPQPYTILYTGRLLGYARVPDSQLAGPNVAAQSRRLNSIVAQDLKKQFERAKENKAGKLLLILGMGDNFAPSLFSRSVDPRTTESESEPDAGASQTPRQAKERSYTILNPATKQAQVLRPVLNLVYDNHDGWSATGKGADVIL